MTCRSRLSIGTLLSYRKVRLMPGYTVRLTVNGKTYTQPLVVRMDPRVMMRNSRFCSRSTAFLMRPWQYTDGIRYV